MRITALFTAILAIGSAGCGDNIITDPVGDPVAFIVAEPLSGRAPLAVSFDGRGSYWVGGIGTDPHYAWNFGDGSTGTGPVTSHTYVVSGLFAACLAFGPAGQDVADTTCVSISVE